MNNDVTTNETSSVRDIMAQYLDKGISRRGFVTALAGIGISAAGVASLVKSADAVETSVNPRSVRMYTGTGGQLMIEQAKDAGAKYLICSTGSAEAGFIDAFFDQPMQMIFGLHEGTSVAIGCGYARATRGPAFMNFHVMGGTAQAAGQMMNAAYDNTPLVMTSGMNDIESFNDDSGLSASPGKSQREVNEMFTKMSWASHDGAAAAHQMRRVFKIATTEPTGPAWIHCTAAMFNQKNVTDRIYSGDTFMMGNDIPACPDKIKAVASALLAARNPVIFADEEVNKQSGEPELMELAELLGIPVGQSTGSQVPFPVKHPLNKGGMNAKGCDLVVAIGCVHLRHNAYGMENDTPLVMISLDREAMGRNHAFSMAIVANTKVATRQLIEEIKGQATAAALKAKADAGMANAPNAGNRKVDPALCGKTPMHREEFSTIVENSIDPEAIIVHETFNNPRQYYSCGHRPGEKGFQRTGGGSLGFGIGCSTGVKLGQPDRQCVCIIGDGAVGFGMAGFWTQARNGIPVLTIVSNNHNYETVRKNYYRLDGRMKAANRYPSQMLDCPDIDFTGLAKSQGLDGMKVTTPADLPAALKRGQEAVAAGTGFIVDVDVERDMTMGGDSTWHQEFNLAALRTKMV